MTLNLKMKN